MNEIATPALDQLDAEELRLCEIVFARLAAFAQHKRRAIALRLAGDVEAALAFERAADDQYQQLPAHVRW